jgi:hypothetical protein
MLVSDGPIFFALLRDRKINAKKITFMAIFFAPPETIQDTKHGTPGGLRRARQHPAEMRKHSHGRCSGIGFFDEAQCEGGTRRLLF